MNITTPLPPGLSTPRAWTLPACGLAVFYGGAGTPQLSHYFLPRLLLRHQRILFVDGANCFSPLRIARFAYERQLPPGKFYECIRVARAFTCCERPYSRRGREDL